MPEDLMSSTEVSMAGVSSDSTNRHGSGCAKPPAEAGSRAKRKRWFELCLVLSLTFGGPLFQSLNLLRNGKDALPHVQDFMWSYGLLREIACFALLGYVLWRRNLRFKDIGLRWSVRDIGMGLLVASLGYVAYVFGYTLVHFAHYAWFKYPPGGVSAQQYFTHLSIATIAEFLINPFVEELIVRAYLMTEIGELTGSWKLATAVSIGVQTSYHLYYGWVTALSLAFQFAIFAIYYAKSRKATPIIVAHGLFDLLALARLW